jgi:hypothetical protein
VRTGVVTRPDGVGVVSGGVVVGAAVVGATLVAARVDAVLRGDVVPTTFTSDFAAD